MRTNQRNGQQIPGGSGARRAGTNQPSAGFSTPAKQMPMKRIMITHIQQPARTIPIKSAEPLGIRINPALLGAIKSRLVRVFAGVFAGLSTPVIRQAVNEAEALAAATGLPHLFLPALAEEKVREARQRQVRQAEEFLRRSGQRNFGRNGS